MKDCRCPGGGADPNRFTVWAEYTKRRAESWKHLHPNAKASSEAGVNGKGGKGKGKGKKGKGGEARAEAVIDQETARVSTV